MAWEINANNKITIGAGDTINITLVWINITQKDGYTVQGQNYEQEYFGKITAISHLR